MFKKSILALIILSLTSSAFCYEGPIVKSKDLYTDGGCSESYFKKAKKINRLVGLGIGGASIAVSTIMPLGWIFVLGGLGTIGESAFDFGHEKLNKQYKTNLKTKDFKEKKPLVRYPIARNYFDILNTIELAKTLNNNTSDTAEFLKMYVRASGQSQFLKDQYKICKSDARLVGISNSEIRDIENELLNYLMTMDQDAQDLTEIDKGKRSFANCLLELTSKSDDELYPVADMLLAKHELKDTALLNWKLKGVVRLYSYILNKANIENKDINIEQYFNLMNKLSEDKSICENPKKPMKRKTLTKEIITTIGQ